MSMSNVNQPILTAHTSYGSPFPRCVTTTTVMPYPLGFARTVFDGEEYTPLSSVTKSDHVSATPWSFYKLTINNPQSILTYKMGAKADLGYYCIDKEYVNETKYDSRGFWPITHNDLLIPTLPKSVTDKIDSIAIVKAQANLRKAAANLPMLYKERAQSVKTIGTYSRAILNNVITMQRRDVKKWLAAVKKHRNRPDRLKEVANTIANRHLEFVFGVLPIIDDILGLVDHITEEKRDFRIGRGAMTNVNVTESFQTKLNIIVKSEHMVRYSVRTAIRCDIDSTVLNDASRLGFNPIYAWYDMTPLSFLTGWFSNLNYWLQSLDGIPGLKFRTGYSTKRTEVNVKRLGNGRLTRNNQSGDFQTKFLTIGKIDCSGSAIRQTRDVMSTMPGLQSLYFVDNTSLFAAAASVSLLIQRLVKTADKEIAVKPFKYRRKKPRYLPPITYRKV